MFKAFEIGKQLSLTKNGSSTPIQFINFDSSLKKDPEIWLVLRYGVPSLYIWKTSFHKSIVYVQICIVILCRSGAMFMAVGNVAILGISALGIFIQQRALLMYVLCFLMPECVHSSLIVMNMQMDFTVLEPILFQ